jgi:hypothetical protein
MKLDRNRTRDRCGISNWSDELIIDEEIAEENKKKSESSQNYKFAPKESC